MECKFWNETLEEAFGSLRDVDIMEIRKLWKSVDRISQILQLALPRAITNNNENFKSYCEVLNKLYVAIKKVSGCRFIIDSSKRPSHGFILSRLPTVQPYVIHLIRNSCAVAYSWQRKKHRPEIYWKQQYMGIGSPVHVALSWNVRNALVHMLKFVNKRYTLLRYEDLCTDWQGSVATIFASLGEQKRTLADLGDCTVKSRSNHTVSGNPIRFERGTIRVSPDIEWLEKMSKRQRMLISGLTWPFLLKYGYLKKSEVVRN